MADDARHVSGERIVLLDAARLVHVAMDPAMLGAELVARAFGAGDDEADPPSSRSGRMAKACGR